MCGGVDQVSFLMLLTSRHLDLETRSYDYISPDCSEGQKSTWDIILLQIFVQNCIIVQLFTAHNIHGWKDNRVKAPFSSTQKPKIFA